jgi:hypothetical protein
MTMERRAPDEEASPWAAWVLDLERAHDQLRHAARLLENGAQPVVDLAPAAEGLRRAFGRMYDAVDERDDRLLAVKGAIAGVDDAMEVLAPAASMDAAIGFTLEYLRDAKIALLHAEERLAPLMPRPRSPAPELYASTDVPRLHAIDRPSLLPLIKVPDAPPLGVEEEGPPTIRKPRTFEELDAAIEQLKQRAEARLAAKKEQRASALPPPPEPPPGFARDYLPALDELGFIRARTRECFEEIAMIGMQRAPLLGDPWRSALVLERRMLASLDAIVAMGDRALAYLEPLVMDAPAKDPSRVFGIAMTLGCLSGRDALAAAERTFLALELGDPECAVQFAGALKLVPHPLLPMVLRTYLADADPQHRAMAIDVLAYRGMATKAELLNAAKDDPKVAAAALPWLALMDPMIARDIADDAIGRGDPALTEAAWLALAYSGHAHAANVVARELEGEQRDAAAVMLALTGDGKDAQRILDSAIRAPTPWTVQAVGWAGAAASIPGLMSFLEGDDERIALAAAYALERITGAGLWEDMEIEPEEILAPDVPDPDVGEPKPPPLAKFISDPRDLPGAPAPETVMQPTVRIDRWKMYWQERGSQLDPKGRYRRGQPYTPMMSVQDLDVGYCTPGERVLLQKELVIRTGSHVRLDPHDFVKVQEEAIEDWRPLAHRASSMPGTWARPLRR